MNKLDSVSPHQWSGSLFTVSFEFGVLVFVEGGILQENPWI